ncbi:hypothetical protein AVEN_77318-1 [Araneus ventricosus]|uniref:Uncharacterized protein n=1 Tax=Araneus ventricosus TaxID=182803 RepID=A0A4Y2UTK7_ARAVE|nr:hypothetical protein AVEN_264287-1 [Araneus ventricosus]GBO15545.1 hypothetical protein AVEN_77318-1 [Araneus ventricosus]
MVSYDATVTEYVPHASLPCRHTMAISLTTFDQVHSRACSVPTHITLPYGLDGPLSDVTASAAVWVPLVSRQNAHATTVADS